VGESAPPTTLGGARGRRGGSDGKGKEAAVIMTEKEKDVYGLCYKILFISAFWLVRRRGEENEKSIEILGTRLKKIQQLLEGLIHNSREMKRRAGALGR